MEDDVTRRLIDLNRQFYQTFAAEFSATRRRVQPGVRRVLQSIPAGKRVLDLGCGNGEVYRLLAQTAPPEFYLGLDFSPGLLADARRGAQAVFLEFDLATDDWRRLEAYPPFDIAPAFAVLHHLPSVALRRYVLRRIRDRLVPGGRLILSNWQFLNSERLRGRIQPWERIGLDSAQLEPGDTLLDWRSGGEGLRYVHHFSPVELAGLAAETGFGVCETFISDGAGGNLSLYQVWERPDQV